MGLFDRFSNNDKQGTEELLKTLTNFTKEDLDALKQIASGNYYRDPRKSPISKEFLNDVERVFSTTQNYGSNSPQNRKSLYGIYDEMDNEVSFVSAALDIISDDATQPDQDGNILTIISSSEKVYSITQTFIEDFNIEEKLSAWARAIAKYGDYFIRVTAKDGVGITKLLDTIYPSEVERLDFDGELIAFRGSEEEISFDVVRTPWDYVHFKHKGDLTSKDRDRTTNRINSENDTHDLTSSYGQSVLRPAVKVYAQLRFVENMLLLSRLTNSIRRNIFMINVGDVAPDKSFETVASYANLLKKNISLNLEEGIYNSQKKTISYDEDIFIPVSDPKNDVRIEQVGGDVNIEEQYDLEYLLNKLFSALKIPKAYLNYEQDLNARSTLIQLDIRYARSVASLQQTIRGGLIRLAKINLAFRGLDPDEVDLDIQLAPVSNIDAETKRQETLAKMEVANSIWRTVTEVNDKLSGDNSLGGSPFPSMPPPMNENNNVEDSDDKNKLDLNYAAELIFKDYIGFSEEEMNKLFKKTSEESNSSEEEPEKFNNSKTRKIKFRKVGSHNHDINAPYPTREGVEIFKKLRENITIKSD